jgi:uncharacterized protein
VEVRYTFVLDANWVTRSAHIACRSALGESKIHLERSGNARWLANGEPMPELGGASTSISKRLRARMPSHLSPQALTWVEPQTLPPSTVRTRDLRVERLEQRYPRLPNVGGYERYDYLAPSFDFKAVLVFDEYGLVLDYPGIAVRVV